MLKRLFVSLCLLMMACAALHADEPSIKISLGIRDTKLLTITNVAYPLAFRIENEGKTAIAKGQISGLFFKGIVHVLPKHGKEQRREFSQFWVSFVHDIQPGATFEHPVVGNLLTFFPSTKDGVYRVWWTLGDLKSNVLHFTVTKGKLSDK